MTQRLSCVVMFERFTYEARRVVVLAREEARELGHAHIGTEHLLLGLIGSELGAAEDGSFPPSESPVPVPEPRWSSTSQRATRRSSDTSPLLLGPRRFWSWRFERDFGSATTTSDRAHP